MYQEESDNQMRIRLVNPKPMFSNPQVYRAYYDVLEGADPAAIVVRSESYGDTWEIEGMIPMGKAFGTRRFILIRPIDGAREILDGEIMHSIEQ